MALTLLASNNASTVLATSINASATSLTVNTGTGSLFPSPVSGTNYFKLTLVDAATGLLTEIVHVTARTGDVMTITRAQEGTTARAWSANDVAANMMTAGTLSLMAQTALSLQVANNLSEISDAGISSVNAALANLGLGPIATSADIQAGTAKKMVDAAGLKAYLPVKTMPGSGYLRIPDVPGGTIIQWGQVIATINEGTQNITLPTPFPTSARFATAIPLNQSGSTTCDIFAQLQSISTTGINFFFSWPTSATPATGFQWFAIGY